MSLSEQDRDRYAKIVRRYFTDDYTMDPDDAVCVVHDVITAYVEDQAARQAAMERVIEAVAWFFAPFDPLVDDGMTHRFVNLEARWSDYKALDATEQEARDGNEQ